MDSGVSGSVGGELTKQPKGARPYVSRCLGSLAFSLAVCSGAAAQPLEPAAALLAAPTATPTVVPTVAPVDVETDFTVSVPKGLSGRLSFSAKVGARDRIMVLDLDGRRLSAVVEHPSNNSAGVWSPNGERLAFVSDRDGSKDIFTVRWDGSDERRVTATPGLNEDQPAWSADGTSIAFVSDSAAAEKADSNIFSINLASGETRQVTKASGRNISPDWSPRGDALAFSTNRFWPGWRIVLFDPKTGVEDFISKASGQVVSQPVYSPSGDRVYFASNTAGSQGIGVFVLSDKKIGWAKYGAGRHLDPAPSPDGEFIAFSYAPPESSTYGVFVMNRKDRTFKSLVTSIHSLRYLSWSGVKAMALEAAKVKALDAAPVAPDQSDMTAPTSAAEPQSVR